MPEIIWMSVVLLGCAEVPEPSTADAERLDAEASFRAADALAPPPRFSWTPVVREEPCEVSVRDFPPGAELGVVAGVDPAPAVCPRRVFGVCPDISMPGAAGTTTLDVGLIRSRGRLRTV